MSNKYWRILFFWTAFSFSLCLASAYFALTYAGEANMVDLMSANERVVNQSFLFENAGGCVDKRASLYDFVKDKKWFPIYRDNVLGVYFDYNKKYYHMAATCSGEKLTVEIKEQ